MSFKFLALVLFVLTYNFPYIILYLSIKFLIIRLSMFAIEFRKLFALDQYAK